MPNQWFTLPSDSGIVNISELGQCVPCDSPESKYLAFHPTKNSDNHSMGRIKILNNALKLLFLTFHRITDSILKFPYISQNPDNIS